MKLLYYKQPKSSYDPSYIYGLVEREKLQIGTDYELLRESYRNNYFFPEGEYCYYIYHKKHLFEKDDYTYFVNMGDEGLYLSYLLALKNEYTLDSIMNQIKGINVRAFVEKGYYDSMQKGSVVRLKGAILYIESKNVGQSHGGFNETLDLHLYADALAKEVPFEYIDTNKLVKRHNNEYSTSTEIPDWVKFCIKAGIRIGVAVIAGYFGSQIDALDFFDDTNISFDTNLSDFETNGIFDGFELGLSDADIFTESADYSNVSFGQKFHVEQIGGGLGEGMVDIDKKPGTAHTWIVKQSGKIIAEIKSLSEVFYVPGIGRCKIK